MEEQDSRITQSVHSVRQRMVCNYFSTIGFISCRPISTLPSGVIHSKKISFSPSLIPLHWLSLSYSTNTVVCLKPLTWFPSRRRSGKRRLLYYLIIFWLLGVTIFWGLSHSRTWRYSNLYMRDYKTKHPNATLDEFRVNFMTVEPKIHQVRNI